MGDSLQVETAKVAVALTVPHLGQEANLVAAQRTGSDQTPEQSMQFVSLLILVLMMILFFSLLPPV